MTSRCHVPTRSGAASLRNVASTDSATLRRLPVVLIAKYNSIAAYDRQAAPKAKGQSMNDRYSHVILTVIAGALIALVTQNAIRPVGAEPGGVQRVVICDARDTSRCAALGTVQAGTDWHYLMVSNGVR
jgi:hypothetical protein